MRIIQSFWTGNSIDENKSFGWLSSKYHYLGWILSVNQLRKYYDNVVLYTDEKGYEILIEKLKLPYSSVEVILDSLNTYDENLWALAKIKAYMANTQPFLHVDGDVFIWEEFGEDLLSKQLISQNIETTSDYYWEMWCQVKPHLIYIPKVMKAYDSQLHNKAYNMGIFGGNDIEFIQKYCQDSIDFVNRNKLSLPKGSAFNFNIFFEQVLLYEMALSAGKNVSFLINENIGDNEYKGFGNFEEIPNNRTYLHLLGFFKRQHLVCNKLDIYVQKFYPEYYKHLEDLLGLKPKLSAFKFDYTIRGSEILKEKYLNTLINKGQISNNTEAIYCRNVISEGKVTFFFVLIDSETAFYLLPLSNYKVNEENEVIEIELLNRQYLEVPMMSIDFIIFELLCDITHSEIFKIKSLDFLDKDFPKSEIKNFIEVLWKRISIFIANGIIYPMSLEEFHLKVPNRNANIVNYEQEEVDAGI